MIRGDFGGGGGDAEGGVRDFGGFARDNGAQHKGLIQGLHT